MIPQNYPITENRPGHVIVIGAGPAGLTAAYLLSKAGVPVTVIEADSTYLGGISKTVEYRGFRFDVGGHRFFSKSQEVEDLWTELLADDMLERPRSSRIYYGGKLYSYPLKAKEALFNLGVLQSSLCMLSYFKAQLFPIRDPRSFEDWVTNQFGKRLFRIFFKTYTEKVWGMSCREISADWAAQRIKGLSLASAVKNALLPARKTNSRTEVVKTLIDSFRYPRKGPGMMWEAAARKTRSRGGVILMGKRVVGCRLDRTSGIWEVGYTDHQGQTGSVRGDHVISSAALADLMPGMRPDLSERSLRAARALRYRDFVTVALILRDREAFSDNWIYIHDPSVRVGRIQNFKSWSPELVPDPAFSCYGLEYFCFRGDGLWSRQDHELVELAKRELEQLELAHRTDVLDGRVIRQEKAYPIYDDRYAANTETVRRELELKYPTFHPVGRNGMHKYNNQDHAMMTAMLTVRNILAGRKIFDVWQVNQDAEYHEAAAAPGTDYRLHPKSVTAGKARQAA